MRVIITGGSGLIGRALCEELAGRGGEVVVLSRRPEAVRGLPAGVQVAAWDGESAAGWGSLVAGAAIVHLAGESIAGGRWTAARKRLLYESRVRSSRAVAAAVAAAREKPRVLLQGSAVGYYGPRGEEEIGEGEPPGEDFLARLCVDWEAATAGVEAMGVRRAVLRTGVVLATAAGALPRMLLPFRLFAGGPVGSGRQWFPWIHAADEVGAIRFLLEREEAAGAFNLVAPEAVTSRGFCRVLGRVLRRPTWLPVPGFALRLAFGDLADTLLTGQRAVPRRLAALGYSFRFPTLEGALRDLLD
jgi:uncharacterized protein